MFSSLKRIFQSFTKQERKIFLVALLVSVITLGVRFAIAFEEGSAFKAISGGTYREGVIGQPIAINPVISANPADADISALVYSSLSDLLSSYEKSKDGKTYTLDLREGLKWDNGKPLTSDDVIFTIHLVQDPDTHSPLQGSWQGVVAERVSELQIQLTIPAPYTFFSDNLKNLLIIPEHIFRGVPGANLKFSGYAIEPIGSGPYKFKDVSKEKSGFIREYHLVPNEFYFGSKPYIQDFYFVFYENENDLLNAFRMRKINGFGTTNPFPKESVLSGTVVNTIPMPRYYAIFFNQNINPNLKNSDVRIALDEAIDKEKIVREVLGGEGSTLSTLDFLDVSSSTGSLGYNPDDARAHLSKSKMSILELNLVVPDIDFLKKTAEIIKNDWMAIGINKVTVIPLSETDLSNNVLKARNYEVVLFGNVLENPEDLFPFWHSSGRFYPGLNLALYQNTKVDTALETIRQTDDEDKRKLMLQTTALQIANDIPATLLFSLPYTYIHTKSLYGFYFEKNTDDFLITPQDRFRNITDWSVAKVRVLQ